MWVSQSREAYNDVMQGQRSKLPNSISEGYRVCRKKEKKKGKGRQERGEEEKEMERKGGEGNFCVCIFIM
jgi:hypothetical protein